jgi:hypothetical protein
METFSIMNCHTVMAIEHIYYYQVMDVLSRRYIMSLSSPSNELDIAAYSNSSDKTKQKICISFHYKKDVQFAI